MIFLVSGRWVGFLSGGCWGDGLIGRYLGRRERKSGGWEEEEEEEKRLGVGLI